MRKAVKPPSEWLNLLCRAWANENPILVATTDAKFLDYKPYLKGLLSSQLLCRLSIPSQIHNTSSSMKTDDGAITNTSIDFWEILGINDAFDRSYIVAQVRRTRDGVIQYHMNCTEFHIFHITFFLLWLYLLLLLLHKKK